MVSILHGLGHCDGVATAAALGRYNNNEPLLGGPCDVGVCSLKRTTIFLFHDEQHAFIAVGVYRGAIPHYMFHCSFVWF